MPWVLMQVIIVIGWPGLVTTWIDTTNVGIDIPQIEMPALDFGPSK